VSPISFWQTFVCYYQAIFDFISSSLVQSFNAHSFSFFVCAVISVIIVGVSKSGFGAGLGILSLLL
jgi:hypothetical protein